MSGFTANAVSMPWRSSRAAVVIQATVLSLGVIFACLLLGAIAAFGSMKIAVLVAAVIGGLSVLALSTGTLLSGLVFLSFIIVGQLFYFGGMGQAVWISFGFGGLLYIKWMASLFSQGSEFRLTSLNVLVALFILSVLISFAVNRSPVFQALAGGKNLVALLSVFLVLSAGLVSRGTIQKIWKMMFWILMFQIPIVLYQYLIVAPSRTRFGSTVGGVEWDAVVGGFGGDPEGGGYSGGMAYFVCVAIAFAVGSYRRGLLSGVRLFLALCAGLLCVGLAEVKVVVVLVPLAAIVMFSPEIKRRPLIAIVGVPVAVVTAFSVLFAYEAVHYANRGGGGSSPSEIVERAFGYSLDPNHVNLRTGELGRVSAVRFWFAEQSLDQPTEFLFGSGPGASRGNSMVGPGEAARRYSFFIDRSAATQLLWDVGMFGFLAYVLACSVALLKALRLTRLPHVSAEDSAILETCAAGLGMLLVMLFYGREPLEAPAISVLAMLMLGVVACYDNKLKAP